MEVSIPMPQQPDEQDRLDKLQKLAEAGVKVLGTNKDLAHLSEHHCRHGTWFFAGATAAAIAVSFTPIGPWWAIAIAVLIGWGMNEWEARKIKARVIC
jgi:hypothetical protein